MIRKPFRPGDRVIYQKLKHSDHPGPRAKDIHPAPHGEDYSYLVDKFWLVREVREDGRLLLITRRGKEHLVPTTDPQLRHPRWWELLLYRQRFPRVD